VSLTEISTRVAIVAALAVIALLVVVRRKPARNEDESPRDRVGGGTSEGWGVDEVVRPPVETLRRKALGTLGLGAIAIFGGIIVAIAVSLSISWIVTNFLNRL